METLEEETARILHSLYYKHITRGRGKTPWNELGSLSKRKYKQAASYAIQHIIERANQKRGIKESDIPKKITNKKP